MAVPAFPHRQQIEEFAPARGSAHAVAAPVQPEAPPFSHLASAQPPTLIGAVERPGDAEQSARRAKRSGLGYDPDALAGYVGGTRSAAALEPPPPPVDQGAAKLARARELLAREPDAERLMQAKVIETFRTVTAPAWRSELNPYPPPVIRIACRLHALRIETSRESDAAARLVLLVDAADEISRMRAYSERDSAAQNAGDRGTAVAQIGLLFGMVLSHDAAIGLEFFAPRPEPVDDAEPDAAA